METLHNKKPIKSLTAEQVTAVCGFLLPVTGSAECWLSSGAGTTESSNKEKNSFSVNVRIAAAVLV